MSTAQASVLAVISVTFVAAVAARYLLPRPEGRDGSGDDRRNAFGIALTLGIVLLGNASLTDREYSYGEFVVFYALQLGVTAIVAVRAGVLIRARLDLESWISLTQRARVSVLWDQRIRLLVISFLVLWVLGQLLLDLVLRAITS